MPRFWPTLIANAFQIIGVPTAQLGRVEHGQCQITFELQSLHEIGSRNCLDAPVRLGCAARHWWQSQVAVKYGTCLIFNIDFLTGEQILLLSYVDVCLFINNERPAIYQADYSITEMLYLLNRKLRRPTRLTFLRPLACGCIAGGDVFY
jgi:hypothetical protein